MKIELDSSFIERYSKKILAFCYGKTHDMYQSQDLSQEIFLSLTSALTGKDIENIDAFVYTVCQYTWSNYLRKNKQIWQSDVYDIDSMYYLSDNHNFEKEMEIRILGEIMMDEITHMTEQYKTIVSLFYFEDMTCERIAEKLNMSVSNVKRILVKIRSRLKEKF